MNDTPVAEAGAGTMLDSGFSGLMGALNVWGRVEEIKAAKSASGGDQIQALYQPELPNGAAVTIDSSLVGKLPEPAGFKINQPLMYGSLALLGFALLLNRKG
jgi:hypothetical protein